MKILTLLGSLVLLTTSQIPVDGYYSAPGSNFGLLALSMIVFIILLTRSRRNTPPSPTTTPLPMCPSGYTLSSPNCGRFCYRFEAQDCKSWNDARASCVADGGDLLVPDICSYPFIQGLAEQNAARCTDFWIGGFRTPPSRDYMTVQGNPLPNNFRFWQRGQPNFRGSRGGEQACVQMANEFNYRMEDDGCSELAGYVCQTFV